MTDYREKFVKAEEEALSLIDELKLLKKEASDYNSASISLQNTQEKVEKLVSEFLRIAKEEQDLINSIKEIDTESIVQEIEKNRTKIEDSSKYQNFVFSKQLFFFYVIIGLNIILGILLIIFR